MSATQAQAELTAVLAATSGLVERLLAEHVAGPDGRCRRCAIGGQAGQQRWPCRIYGYAAAAARPDPLTPPPTPPE